MVFVEKHLLVFVFMWLLEVNAIPAAAPEWGRLKRDIMNSARFEKSCVQSPVVIALSFTQNLIGVMSGLSVKKVLAAYLSICLSLSIF